MRARKCRALEYEKRQQSQKVGDGQSGQVKQQPPRMNVARFPMTHWRSTTASAERPPLLDLLFIV